MSRCTSPLENPMIANTTNNPQIPLAIFPAELVEEGPVR